MKALIVTLAVLAGLFAVAGAVSGFAAIWADSYNSELASTSWGCLGVSLACAFIAAFFSIGEDW